MPSLRYIVANVRLHNDVASGKGLRATRRWVALSVVIGEHVTDFETVLVTPKPCYDRNERACRVFDRYISHEDIARFIPLFSQGTMPTS